MAGRQRMIKNIIFDIGSVLVQFRPAEVMESIGITGARLNIAANATFRSTLWSEFDRGVLSEEEIINAMRTSVPEENRKDIDLFFAQGRPCLIEPFSYSALWLKSLKERGYKIFLLSNYPKSFFDLHSKSFPFMPYIDGKIISADVQLIKPDPAIYKLMISTFSFKPEECVFIDDVPVNVQVAHICGINGIIFISYDDATQKLEELLKKK